MVAVEVISPYREVEKNKLHLNMHPGQAEVWLCKKRFLIMLAGTQGGKTCFGVDWLYREIKENGPGDYLAVTATFPLLNLKLLPEFLYVFRDILKLGEYKEFLKTFMFDRAGEIKVFGKEQDIPTRVIFGSATNPESIESATAKAAWLDEPGQKQFRRDAWEAIRRRLSIHQGRALFTTTLYGLGWLKNEFYDRWIAGEDEDIEVIQFDSILNPVFPREEYNKARLIMPGWKFDMFYRGRYSKPAGMVYDAFDERVCIIPRFNLPNEWPRYVGMDFGPVNTACIWYAQDPSTGFLYAYREYRAGGLSAGGHAEELKRLSGKEWIMKRVGGSHQEQGWRDAFTMAGWITTEPNIRDVNVGILKVYAFHKLNKLFVFNDLEQYLDEKLSYSWELDDNYMPTEKIENKERYHLMDAERYIVSDFTPQDTPSRGDSEKIPVWDWGGKHRDHSRRIR